MAVPYFNLLFITKPDSEDIASTLEEKLICSSGERFFASRVDPYSLTLYHSDTYFPVSIDYHSDTYFTVSIHYHLDLYIPRNIGHFNKYVFSRVSKSIALFLPVFPKDRNSGYLQMVNIGFGQQYLRKNEYGVDVKFLCNLQPNTPGVFHTFMHN